MSRILKALLIFAVLVGGAILALYHARSDRPTSLSLQFWDKLFGQEVDKQGFDYGGEALARVHRPRQFGAWLSVNRGILGGLVEVQAEGMAREVLAEDLSRDSVRLTFKNGEATGLTYVRRLSTRGAIVGVELILDEALRQPPQNETDFEMFFIGAIGSLWDRGSEQLWSTLEVAKRVATDGRAWLRDLRRHEPHGRRVSHVERVRGGVDGIHGGAPGVDPVRVAFDQHLGEGLVIRYSFSVRWDGVLWRTSDFETVPIDG